MTQSVTENRSGASIAIEIIAEDAKACDACMTTYLERYHPLGYGTSFTSPVSHDDGSWHASGYRRASCD